MPDTTDLQKRLRDSAPCKKCRELQRYRPEGAPKECREHRLRREAADALEAQQAELTLLREEIARFQESEYWYDPVNESFESRGREGDLNVYFKDGPSLVVELREELALLREVAKRAEAMPVRSDEYDQAMRASLQALKEFQK